MTFRRLFVVAYVIGIGSCMVSLAPVAWTTDKLAAVCVAVFAVIGTFYSVERDWNK